MTQVALITGASSGIGKSLALALAQRNILVIGVGRDINKLNSVIKEFPNNLFVPIAADITKAKQRITIRDAVIKNTIKGKLNYLIHNATVLAPIKSLSRVTEKEIKYQTDVNYTAPLFLTKQLLPYLASASRVLFISTGASRSAISRLVPHCAAKSAQAILALGLRTELKEQKIHVGIVEPGIVDTPAQAYLREFSADQLPFSETARQFYQEGKLISCQVCGEKLARLLCDMDAEKFMEIWPWQLNNEAHELLLQ